MFLLPFALFYSGSAPVIFLTIVLVLVSEFAFFLFAIQSFPGASSYLQVL